MINERGVRFGNQLAHVWRRLFGQLNAAFETEGVRWCCGLEWHTERRSNDMPTPSSSCGVRW